MHYALAHDEEGIPLEVPPSAIGWLVRRHAGGRGRPGSVYDGDGRPLVVALDATAGELRGLGCKPGTYRLDAVDGNRRPLGVAGFTEVVGDGEGVDPEGRPSGDPAVMALARAVEAMQRVQAERERVQAEMFAKIIDRLTPAPPHPALDVRNAVTQVLDLQKTLREAMASEEDGADDDGGEQAWWSSPAFGQMVSSVLPVLMRWMTGASGKVLAPRNRPAAAVAAGAGSLESTPSELGANGGNGAAGAGSGHGAASANGGGAVANGEGCELTEKMEAVLARLEPEERAQVMAALPRLPAPVRAQVEAVIAAASVEEAVGVLREYLAVARRSGGAS
jgi:hypothetical protein